MSNKDNIEDLFRKRFGNQESPVSDRVWENIKQTLPPEDNRPSFYPFFIAGIILIGLIAGSWYYFQEEKKGSSIAANETGSPGIKEETENQSENFTNEKNSNNNLYSEELKQDQIHNTNGDDKNFPLSSAENNSGNRNSDLKGKRNEKTGKIYPSKSNDDNNTNNNSKELTNTSERDKKGRNKFNHTKSGEDNGNLIALDYAPKDLSGKNKGSNIEEASIIDPEKTGDKNVENLNSEKDIKFSDYHVENKNNNNITDSLAKENENTESGKEESDKENKYVEEKSEQNNKDEKVNVSNNDENYSKGKEFDNKEKNSPEDPTLIMAGNPAPEKDSSLSSPVEEDSIEVKEEQPKDSTSSENGKKNENENKKPLHISADLFGSPALTYRSLSGSSEVLGNRNEYERSKFNIGGGVRLNIGISEKVSVNGGVGIVAYGEQYNFRKEEITYHQKLQYDTIWTQDSLSPGWNYYVTIDTVTTETRNVTEHSGTNRYRYMEIPLSATYIFRSGKLSIGITGGVTANILLSAYTGKLVPVSGSGSYQLIEENSGSNSPFRPLTFGAFINPAIIYNVKGNWAIFAEPGFKLLLTSVYKKEENVSLKPYGANINVGVRYVLK